MINDKLVHKLQGLVIGLHLNPQTLCILCEPMAQLLQKIFISVFKILECHEAEPQTTTPMQVATT